MLVCVKPGAGSWRPVGQGDSWGQKMMMEVGGGSHLLPKQILKGNQVLVCVACMCVCACMHVCMSSPVHSANVNALPGDGKRDPGRTGCGVAMGVRGMLLPVSHFPFLLG